MISIKKIINISSSVNFKSRDLIVKYVIMRYNNRYNNILSTAFNKNKTLKNWPINLFVFLIHTKTHENIQMLYFKRIF